MIESNSITDEGVGQGLNSIDYTFDHWWDDNTTASRNFTPTGHSTYTAYFAGKPQHVTITKDWGEVGTPVRIEWQDHPNTNVTQYQVWRKVKHNGVWQGPALLTTLNRGDTTYTDPDYLFTDGYTHDMLQYDIRAYYILEQTYADPNYVTTYGQLYKMLAQLNPHQPRPTEYAIASYPNPFNPATTISFQLPEAAHVAITIYNMNGQRVWQLAEQNLQEGYYHLAWDGKATNGQALTSGYYFARMVVNPTGGGETRVLTQRMLFMK